MKGRFQVLRAKLRPGKAILRAKKAKIRPESADLWPDGQPGGTYGWTDGRMDGWNDGCLEFHPCPIGHRFFGAAAHKGFSSDDLSPPPHSHTLVTLSNSWPLRFVHQLTCTSRCTLEDALCGMGDDPTLLPKIKDASCPVFEGLADR